MWYIGQTVGTRLFFLKNDFGGQVCFGFKHWLQFRVNQKVKPSKEDLELCLWTGFGGGWGVGGVLHVKTAQCKSQHWSTIYVFITRWITEAPVLLFVRSFLFYFIVFMFVHVRLFFCQVKCAQIKACECKPSGLSALPAAFVFSELLGLKMLPDDPPPN